MSKQLHEKFDKAVVKNEFRKMDLGFMNLTNVSTTSSMKIKV